MEHSQLAKILVVDDDRSVHLLVQKSLADIAKVISATTAQEGLGMVAEQSPDVVLLDIQLPDTNGLALFCQIHELDTRLPVIFITVDAGSETAIEAMQLGAYDYVGKPLRVQALRALVNRAITTRRMVSTPVAIAADETARALGGVIRRPQPADAGGLQSDRAGGQAERHGSGPRRERHRQRTGRPGAGPVRRPRARPPSWRSTAPRCPENLLESELFGHEKGAFTGAESRRIGKFEQCNGGTLFLDEIGDMSPAVQAKVLRVLQEQHFERVGGTKLLKTDVRMIAATNRDLEAMVEEGEFREDLLYRLNGVTINLPPLRERVGDIPDLLHYFPQAGEIDLKKPQLEGISAEATELICALMAGERPPIAGGDPPREFNTTGPAILPESCRRRSGSWTMNPPASKPEDPSAERSSGGLDLSWNSSMNDFAAVRQTCMPRRSSTWNAICFPVFWTKPRGTSHKRRKSSGSPAVKSVIALLLTTSKSTARYR